MNTSIYQAETERLARYHQNLLQSASDRLETGETLSDLEQQGIIHSLQVIVENAIGKAKNILKVKNLTVPVSGYDAFEALTQAKLIAKQDLEKWQKIVGLRNSIVHDYMNLDMAIINRILHEKQYEFILRFLERIEV